MDETISVADLQAASDSFYAALAAVLGGTVTPMLELWSRADDTCYMGPMGGVIVGSAAIEAAWLEQADSLLGGEVTPADLHFVTAGPLGIVTGWEHGVGHRGIPDGIHIRATSTYRREDGQIKMIGHHTDLIALPGVAGS